MKNTLLSLVSLSLLFTQVAVGSIESKETIQNQDVKATDGSSLVTSSEDRVVNGDGSDKFSDPEAKKFKKDDNDENNELKDKNSGTADVQVVYRIHGALERNLKQHTESEMSEALCDREAYEDCDDEEIELKDKQKHFDVISYDVLDRDNGDAPEETRMRTTRQVERSTEVVYRKNGEPAYDRSHRIRLRERGSNRVYIATLREAEKEESAEVEGEQGSNRTLWLSRLERANGDES